MAQQYTDRAFESAFVLGLNNVTLLGPKFNYVGIPLGDSICLIEALVNNLPNGEWEVNAGVRTGNTFTRGTVIASSDAGASVNFSGETTEIALVVSSEFYESISAAVIQNTSNIAQNASDIGNNAGQIAQNVSDISNNAGNINQNAIDIAQNASDISGKEASLGNPAQDGQGLVSTALGVRSWETLVKYFVDLLDTPASYVGQAGKLLKVNATADGLIFGDPSGTTVSWGSIEGLLSDQIDLQNALNAKLNTDGTAANSLLLQGQNGAFYLDRANQTGIQDLDTISFPNVGVSDLNNLQEAVNHAWNAGVILKGGITDNGGCTVNIAEYEIVFRVGTSDHDQLIALIVPAQIGLIVGAGVAGVIIASYNGGAPIYSLVPSGTEINARTDIALGLVACDGTLVTILSLTTGNTDAMNIIGQRFLDLGLAHVPGGTVLGESGVRNITITAGAFWLSLQIIPNIAFDSSLTDTFTYWFSDGAGGWSSQINQTQISNTLFDDGSGTLAPILNNDYSQSWVYITGSDAGFETHVLYGDLSANTEDDVLTTSPPSVIPPKLQFLGVLVGRVIVREAVDPFVAVESAFATEYKPGGVTVHNNLAGLQGGAFDDYYHVTQADLTYFGTIPAQLDLKADIDGQVPENAPDYLLNALDIIVNTNTMIDVFIYDTTKDDDGGAWVDEASTQSWYHEALNTADRGNTRPFPKVALIVAESDKVTIYDATISSCPMWMVFISANANVIKAGIMSSVSMLNSELIVGNASGVIVINFVYEDSYWRNSASMYRYFGSISARNESTGFSTVSGSGIINDAVNDLAIVSNGRSENTIYVATAGGLSRIANDGSVSDWTDLGGITNLVGNIAIFENYAYWTTNSGSSGLYLLAQLASIPLIDSLFNSTDQKFSGLSSNSWTVNRVPLHFDGINSLLTGGIVDKAVCSNRALTKLYPNGGDAMICNIAADFISGILYGDIQVALSANISGVLADRSYKNKSFTGTYDTADVAIGAELKSFTPTITDMTVILDSVPTNLTWWEKISGDWTYQDGSGSINVSNLGTTLTINLGTEVALVRADANITAVWFDIEQQEKRLFNENAKCTLQGTSSDCKAVAYSEFDNIVAVCSADHITRFNDLIVQSDEAVIATSISRGCGNKEITGS